ncbi:PVC-type heme-binding CxxCH protein [Cyclobacterium sp. SYSU L10401]|uniref:PVC-type heme-binding CxxCH protein n=1 Tax=Cyclobacterium sp. SYSU L10401 TaxID=2678657 RepID=UPI001F0902BF|nr:PVC-type heme-binding CxxCH protein [Cyclobacterium sp. SYSU L10401]
MPHLFYRMPLWISLLFLVISVSCTSDTKEVTQHPFDQLTEEEKRMPENALLGIKVNESVQVNLFASEPMLTNPTNIDIDHKGRVWVCEAYNYRPAITGNETKAEGDRILILEDTDGDGTADKSTVFYQDPELNAPLGIWVMGNQAIVSQSPYVWLLTDTDGDDQADKKEVIFKGIGGEQHDHGMHAFVFGPDGKFYFNFGNSGGSIEDRNGEVLKDTNGDPILPEHYKEGLIFRCNPDFTEIEVLGQNFRNNYEVAVDSYGTMWQSDNDDDGNKGVRINYVMEYGNFGYKDEMTGAGWRANRTNKEKEIPEQHWHLNDPGVVPNLLQTGAGSPTGMVVYEGRALPEIFWDQMIHTDAGPNVVRAYPVEKDGAGYKASIVNIMEGDKDQWFRPSDVCVAPDGSLMVSDWYDPGVGGHQVGDLNRGRIFRITNSAPTHEQPEILFNTLDGTLEALLNPNLSTRYLAWKNIKAMGKDAAPALERIFYEDANPRFQARAFWALAKIDKESDQYIQAAINHENPDLRIAGLRAARQAKLDLTPYLKELVSDTDPQVRREAAIAIRNSRLPNAPELWATLATQHDGEDRWYLEALGIGAAGQWDSFYNAWLAKTGDELMTSKKNQDIIWRSRTGNAVPHLADLASDQSQPLEDRLRYFRAFDFNPDKEGKSAALVKMLEEGSLRQENQEESNSIHKLVLTHLDPDYLNRSEIAQEALRKALDESVGTEPYLELIQKFEVQSENPRLLEMALNQSDNNLGRTAASLLLRLDGINRIKEVLYSGEEEKVYPMLLVLRGIGTQESLQMLEDMAFDSSLPLNTRREATSAIGGSYGGEEKILELLKSQRLPDNLIPAAVTGVSRAWRKSVRAEAASYLDSSTDDENPLPPMNELLAMEGSEEKGLVVFKNHCALCHQAGDVGMDFGPKLTEIGSKLSKEAQYISILHPDAGISFGYEGYVLQMKDGSTLGGIIASQTETDIELKMPGGNTVPIKTADMNSMEQMENSMMPSGLEKAMSTQELVDLVAYLMSLKKES